MTHAPHRAVCWKALWNERCPGLGLEHLQFSDGSADGVVLAFDDDGRPFRLTHRLNWDADWRLREADLMVVHDGSTRRLGLRTNGAGQWRDPDGAPLPALDGCVDIDIWPTPFTNSFPIRRLTIAIGERHEIKVAWVSAPALSVQPQRQAYTRLADRRYRFESLDGSGFQVELEVDDDGLVIDYPGLFERVGPLR